MEEAGVKLVAQGAAAFGVDMKGAEKAVGDFGVSVSKTGDLVQDAAGRWRTASGRFASDAEKAAAGIKPVGSAVKDVADQVDHAGGRINAAGQVMIGALRKVGAVAVEAFLQAGKAAIAFVGDSITLAGEFDQTMSVLQATAGATADELAQVSAKAKELGADLTLPATSAVDAGEAMLELAKAGFTVQESMDAAKGVLQLAAAAQIEEAKAAEINANAINAFNLEAKDSVFVSDLLAASANASSVEITDVAAAYQMAGAIFSNFQGPVVGSKNSIIDLTTAIGILGNAGIKGSDAGTALKQSLLQLTGPSQKAKDAMVALFLATQAEGDAGQNLDKVLAGNAKARSEGLAGLYESAGAMGNVGDIAYDAAGNMRPFEEILALTAQATKGMNDEQRNLAITTIFGADAARAILVLMNEGPATWDKMTDAVTKQGAAQALAEAQTKGFKGALEGAKSQIETLQLTIGQALTPVLADLLNNVVSPGIATLTDLAGAILGDEKAFNKLSPAMQEVVTFAEDVGAAIDELMGLFDQGITVSSDLGNAIDDLSGIWTKAGEVVADVLGGYQDIIDSILPQVEQFIDEHGEEISGFFKTTWDTIIEIVGLALDLYDSIVPPILHAIADFIDAHGSEIQRILKAAWETVTTIIGGALGLIKSTIKLAIDAIHGDWDLVWTDLGTITKTLTDTISGTVEGFLNIIAGFFDTNLAEIGRVWKNNWDTMVSIVGKIADRMPEIGRSIVQGIQTGLANAWGSLVSWLIEKMQNLFDQAMNAIKGGSPALMFVPVGASAVEGIMKGFGDLWPALTKLVEGLGEDLVQQAADIGRSVQGAIAASFGATASIDRQIADNLDRFEDVLPQYRQFTEGALKDAAHAARQFLDPTEGAQFFKMRSDQILEFAKLQKDLAEAETDAEKKRITAKMNLINAAQTAEISGFNANLGATLSGTESLMAALQGLMAAQGVDEKGKPVGLPGVLENSTIAAFDNWIRQLTNYAPNPYRNPMMSGSTTYNQQRQYTMPIYTNNTPEAMQQSMAMAGAMYP